MVDALGHVKRNPRRRRPSLRVAPEVTDPSNIVQTFWKHSKVGRSWRSRRAPPTARRRSTAKQSLGAKWDR